MSSNTKLVLGIVAGLVILCLAACVAAAFFTGIIGQKVVSSAAKGPEEAAAAAKTIAIIDMPPGYKAIQGIQLAGVSMIMYQKEGSNTGIFLMEMPSSKDLNDADIETLEKAFQQGSGSSGYSMHLVDKKDLKIRGGPGKIFISEGVNANNLPYRQVVVIFRGNNGLAMLGIIGPVKGWDSAAFDRMVLSIR